MRLIDADALKKKAYPFPCAIGAEYAVTIRAIGEAPTIDAVPVVHAKWVENDLFEHRCTNCGNRIPFYHCYSDESDDEWDEEIDLTKFCPNCGAMMDAE